MSAELIQQAAELLTPILLGGAGAAAAAGAAEAGSDFYQAARSVLTRIHGFLRPGMADVKALTAALQQGVDQDLVTLAELRDLVLAERQSRVETHEIIQINNLSANQSFVGNQAFHGDITFSS